MTEKLKEKLEARKAELQADFDFLGETIKVLQKEIADKQRQIQAGQVAQVQISGAFQEVNKQLN
ncbi:MAG: hypothetical protein WC332_02105 [Clostridia bacterium]|jgi:hypothetical protein